MVSAEEVEGFEKAGWKVAGLGDVRVAGERCLADPWVRGRVVVVCKGVREEGDRVFDCCDDLVDGMGGGRCWGGGGGFGLRGLGGDCLLIGYDV